MGLRGFRYTLASKLVNELVEAADDKQLTKLINRCGRVDLILRNRCSKFLPNAKSVRPSRLPPTSHSRPGQRHSPIPGYARP
jgi:hypothetical protein